MFHRRRYTVYSDFLDLPGVSHCFATRFGGVSTIPEVASMNLDVRMGDTPENVAENIARLASYTGFEGDTVIFSRQIHSTNILTVTREDTLIHPDTREFDGYVTRCAQIPLLVRTADCLPILFAGTDENGDPVIGSAHAGWRGTVSGIAPATVERMCELGAVRDTVRVAIGPSILECCFEVREDFIESVSSLAGSDFANRHIHKRDGKYFASLQDMNVELLTDAGIPREHIDISPDCTAHMSDTYHSHRATGGMRGAGGGIIGITNK